jgi:hypothetical protein
MTITPTQRIAGVAVDHENREKDDFNITPPAATEGLLEVEEFDGAIWECACGIGAISKVLEAQGHDVVSTDLVDRGYGEGRIDFLLEWQPRAPNIVTNPPYKIFEPFLKNALTLYSGKLALLLPLRYLAGVKRGEIYKASPPARCWIFSARIKDFHRAGWTPTGNGGMIDFMWMVWEKGYVGKMQTWWI